MAFPRSGLLLLSAVLLGMAAMAYSAGSKDVLVVFSNKHKKNNMAVYWVIPDTGHEQFLEIVKPGASVTQRGPIGSVYAVRSSDLLFRTKVEVMANDDTTAKQYPYKLAFYNLHDKPIELKHGDAGYLWIEPASAVSQVTHTGHFFELLEKAGVKSTGVVSFRVEEPNSEL